MKAAGKPGTTRYLRDYQLRRCANNHPDRSPWTLTTDELLTWLAGHDWAPETLRGYRAALRSFYGWGHAAGRTDNNPAALLPTIRPVHHPPRPAPEDVLLASLREAGDRERLMILLAARQGLRRSDIARVHSADLMLDLLGWSLRVRGKGNKERIVPLGPAVQAVVRSRLEEVGSGWLFPSPGGGHLTPAHVGVLVSRLLGPGWTTHTLRHRFATVAYGAERDLLAVQELLGHSKVETTRGYIRFPDAALRAAVHAAA